MKKIAFSCLLIAASFLVFNACKKEADILPPQDGDNDQIIELPNDLKTIGQLLDFSDGRVIGYLDDNSGILFVNFDRLEDLKEEFTPLSISEYEWVIEKNGQPKPFFLAPLEEIERDKEIGEEDEITREDEYCKEGSLCWYGRTHMEYYQHKEAPGPVCVVKKGSKCTGKKKTFEVEVHDVIDCLSPVRDENGKIVTVERTIMVCSR